VTTLDEPIMTFQAYLEAGGDRGLGAEGGSPPYAHPMDGWILKTLDAMPVKHVLDTAIDTLISVQLGRFIAQSIPIDHKSFPQLYELVSECSERLGIAVPHALMGSFGGSFNAFTAGTDEYNFLFVTDGLLKHFPLPEAHFVVGHECGHIAAKHLIYHTLLEAMTDTALGILRPAARMLRLVAGTALLAWSRRSEITCDRAGLLCCGDLQVAERALVGLVAGFAGAKEVDIDQYLRRYREMSDYHGASAWQELFYTHPMIPKRIEGLRLFARSELYFELRREAAPAGVELLSRAELDQLTGELVRP